LNASIREFVEDAHAETVVKLGPLNPYFMDMWPAGISEISFGMKNGLYLGIPFPLSKF
jgi:hypothetical protein